MIVKRTIKPQTITVYEPNGEMFGVLNMLELLDLRIQVAEQKIPGYHFIWDNKRIDLEINGNLSQPAEGLGDNMLQYTMKLHNIQLNIENGE